MKMKSNNIVWEVPCQEDGIEDWHERHIEEPIRDIVRLLRNNGFNTTCSCGHKMYIEFDWDMRDGTNDLHHLLFLNAVQNYEITIRHTVEQGHTRINCLLEIKETIDEIIKRKIEWKTAVEDNKNGGGENERT
jgi:hypothetical protein